MTEYPSLEAFYAADERRRRSEEADYGVWWVERGDQRWPTWRVSYIKATGEVYALELGQTGRVKLLGAYPPDEGDIYYRSLDQVLVGWAEAPRRYLSWVVERLDNNPRRVT